MNASLNNPTFIGTHAAMTTSSFPVSTTDSPLAASRQLLLVVADDWASTTAKFRRFERALPGADFRAALVGYGITPTEPPDVLWNFEKFLIGKDCKVAGRFAPGITPDDPALVAAIDAELAK